MDGSSSDLLDTEVPTLFSIPSCVARWDGVNLEFPAPWGWDDDLVVIARNPVKGDDTLMRAYPIRRYSKECLSTSNLDLKN